MRTVTVLVNDTIGNPDAFDVLHKYRFVIFSISDILNGLSVLYCFHSMASVARKHRSQSTNEPGMSTVENNNDMRESINEMLINRMRKKNSQSSYNKRV